MKSSPATFSVLLAAVLLAEVAVSNAQAPAQVGKVTPQNAALYFSPGGGCTQAIVNEVDKAKTSILVQAYTFTSTPIAKALVQAKKRGVKVEVILDKINRTQNSPSADFIVHAGIPTLLDTKHSIAHNKVMVIDSETIITGSFNFSAAAEEHNADNLLVIHDKTFAAKFAENWRTHRAHSEVYEGN